MLRRAAVLLLIANLLYFAWTQGWLDDVTGVRAQGDREPERLARQVRPDSVVILPPSAAIPTPAASAPASTTSAAEPGATTVCLEAGPFATGASVSALAALQNAALPAGSWSNVKVERPGSWIAYMGRYANREALAKKEDELRRARINFEPVLAPPELEPGLSLGRYEQRGAAERALEQLAQRGVRTARVVELVAPATLHLLRVEKADAALAAQLAALRSEALGRGFVPCGSS
jgi:hypothetical protein